ncbi:MAG: hypothetical protein OSB03_11470 [Vicinamibacterales bacterium]|jgi:hypothetical protein|nr:hypothetical protein [Vicinamibacterales bacterium]
MLRDCCSDTVKGAAIIGGAIIVAMAMWIYFSPFQSCMRTVMVVDEARYENADPLSSLETATGFCHPNSGR